MRFLSLIALLAVSGQAAAVDDALPWAQADYKARKLFMTARLSIGLERVSGEALQFAAPTPFEGKGIMPVCRYAILVTLESEAVGETKEISLYFDPISGAALRRQQREWSSKPDFKDLRFTTGGIARLRAEPLAGDEDKPPAEWGQVRRQFRSFPEVEPAVTITDTAALPYLVATHDWQKLGDEFEVFVFEDEDIVRITASARQWQESAVDYRLGDRKIDARERLLDVQLLARRLLDDGSADIDLFGLSGDLHMLVDVARRLPVQISGSVGLFGEVRFILKGVQPVAADG